MAKITKVPDGPLIKKKGTFKGSTLKAGGTIKKYQNSGEPIKPSGKTWFQMSPSERKNKQTEVKTTRGREGFTKYMDSVVNSNFERNAATRGMTTTELRKDNKKSDIPLSGLSGMGNDKPGCAGSEKARARIIKKEARRKNGGMIKRADGSTSQRGLWDNIRASKGSGKKPTAAMLKQEKKIKSKK